MIATCRDARCIQQISLAAMSGVGCLLLGPRHIHVQLVGGALVLCGVVSPLQAQQVSGAFNSKRV